MAKIVRVAIFLAIDIIVSTRKTDLILDLLVEGECVSELSHRQGLTFSAVSIHMKDVEYYAYASHKVVAYFVFSRLGIAVPLRQGDILFFSILMSHIVFVSV